MTASKNNQPQDRSSLIVLLLLLGAGFLLFKYLGEESPLDKSSKRQLASPGGTTLQHTSAYGDSVNRHLMMTNEKAEMARQRMAVDNNNLAKDFYETSAQNDYSAPTSGIDLNGENNAKSVAKDIGRGEKVSGDARSPHDMIQAELYNAQQEQAYSEAYRQEYARQFVENARRGGYQVQLDENFKVISVKPLRKPTANQNLELFGGNGAGRPLQ